jgi:enoyl-CoA hydratase
MTDEYLHVETSDGIRTITLDRPEARNAMTLAMRTRLCELFDEASADDDVAAVILTAVDPVFSGGVDIKEVAATAPAKGAARVMSRNPATAAQEATKPILVAVNGSCVTGALEIALACDIIVASERARFADTHARIGLIPAWGMSARLPRSIGLRKAKELSLTGNFIAAPEARRLGLVNHVVPHDELIPRTRQLAHDIADAEPGAVRTLLALYKRGDGASLDEAIAYENEVIASWVVDRGAMASRRAATMRRGSAAIATPSTPSPPSPSSGSSTEEPS